MPILRQQQYVHVDGLYCFDNVTTIEVMRIFEVNCFNFGDRAAVFLTATRFNHSCLPNTYYSWSEKRGKMVFQSMINVPESEELTICYMGRPFCTHLKRRSRQRTHIRCACSSCQPTLPLGHASNTHCLFVRSLDQIVAFEIKMNRALLVHGL